MLNRLLFVVIIFIFASCKSSFVSTNERIANKSYFESSLKQSNAKKIKYSYKGKITVNKKNYNVKINYIQYSSSEQYFQVISNSLGVEIAKFYLNKDSIIYINRLDKKYFKGAVSELIKFKNISTKIIGNLINGNNFELNNNYVLRCNNFKYELDYSDIGIIQNISLNSRNKLVQCDINFDDKLFQIKYSNYNKNMVPNLLVMNVLHNDYNISAELDLVKAEKMKKNLNSNIKIPKNYLKY